VASCGSDPLSRPGDPIVDADVVGDLAFPDFAADGGTDGGEDPVIVDLPDPDLPDLPDLIEEPDSLVEFDFDVNVDVDLSDRSDEPDALVEHDFDLGRDGDAKPDADADIADVDIVEEPDVVTDPDTGDLFGGGDRVIADIPVVLPPFIVVDPEEITFPDTGLDVSSFADLTISNIGPDPQTVFEVVLDLLPTQGFRILETRPLPTTLDPGESFDVTVRFRPTALSPGGGPTNYANAVLVISDDPATPEIVVDLSGLALPEPTLCLDFTESVFDFGPVTPPDSVTESVSVENCGDDTVELDGLTLAVGAGSAFSIDAADGDLPAELGPGDSFEVDVTFSPVTFARAQDVLTATAGDLMATLQLLGGAECPEAVIRVDGAPLFVDFLNRDIGEEIELSGSESVDPAGGDFFWAWEIEAPAGSEGLSIDPDLFSEELTFVPDVSGFYEVSLIVTSDASFLPSCVADTATIAVDPPPAVEVILTWDNGADLDLHVLRSNGAGAFGDFGGGGGPGGGGFNDCYWANPNPDWGDAGDPSDNPQLDGDDTDGFGPERTTIPVLEAGRRYKIGVNYARPLGTESVTATVELTVGDAVQVMTATWDADGPDYWVPFIIDDDGTITAEDSFE